VLIGWRIRRLIIILCEFVWTLDLSSTNYYIYVAVQIWALSCICVAVILKGRTRYVSVLYISNHWKESCMLYWHPEDNALEFSRPWQISMDESLCIYRGYQSFLQTCIHEHCLQFELLTHSQAFDCGSKVLGWNPTTSFMFVGHLCTWLLCKFQEGRTGVIKTMVVVPCPMGTTKSSKTVGLLWWLVNILLDYHCL